MIYLIFRRQVTHKNMRVSFVSVIGMNIDCRKTFLNRNGTLRKLQMSVQFLKANFFYSVRRKNCSFANLAFFVFLESCSEHMFES